MKKFMRFTVFALFLSLTAASSAQACYSAREQEAEQGLRINSELMVIGLTCARMPQGHELYSKYQQFTQKNADLIAEYETNLINYYSSQGISNPENKLNTLRTDMANEISSRAISMSTHTFCDTYSSHIDRALEMDQHRLRQWAQSTWPNQPASERMCSGI
jgi:hypothetical protein